MRVGMVGLAALYWPLAIGNGLQGREGVQFLSAATLSVSEPLIQATLGMTAAEYADALPGQSLQRRGGDGGPRTVGYGGADCAAQRTRGLGGTHGGIRR